MSLRRKKTFVVYKEAQKVGAYDERPMLPDHIHLQVYLSRNDHPQPFWLICEKDTMLVCFAGTGRVAFQDTGIRWFPFEPGDHVYVPAGAPTRLLPDSETVVLRYKAQNPGLEGVAWYCEGCGLELYRHVFDTADTVAHRGYVDGTQAFNADSELRTCTRCAAVHPEVDLGRYRWEQLAADLAEG